MQVTLERNHISETNFYTLSVALVSIVGVGRGESLVWRESRVERLSQAVVMLVGD